VSFEGNGNGLFSLSDLSRYFNQGGGRHPDSGFCRSCHGGARWSDLVLDAAAAQASLKTLWAWQITTTGVQRIDLRRDDAALFAPKRTPGVEGRGDGGRE